MLGYDVGILPTEDLRTNVIFIPEYVPVSHIRRTFPKSTIVVVWREYNLGIIENLRHDINIVTDNKIPIKSATWIPESVPDIFSIVGSVSKERKHIIENDDEPILKNKTAFEIAHVLKNTKVYKGKKFIKEACVSGCEVSESVVLHTKNEVAKILNEFLDNIKILIFLEDEKDEFCDQGQRGM